MIDPIQVRSLSLANMRISIRYIKEEASLLLCINITQTNGKPMLRDREVPRRRFTQKYLET
jgi:hypothetical protein